MSHTVESQPERREFTLIMYLFMILAGLLVVGVFLWVMLQVFGPLIAFIGLVLTLIGGWFATQYGYERFVVGPRLDNELKQEQRDFQRMLTAGLGIAAQDPNANVRVSELPQGGRTYEIIRTLPENTHRPRVSVEEVEAPPEQKALPAPATRSEEEESAEPVADIPTAPVFPQMQHLITQNKMPLCWVSENGRSVPAYGTVDDLLSMAITGKPGRGKTTALMYYVCTLLTTGAEVWVWDPHGVMGELAGLNGQTLPGVPPTAKIVYLDRREDIVASIPQLHTELDQRDELYRATRRVKHPLLILADELPVLASYDEATAAEYKQINKQRQAGGKLPVEPPIAITLIKRVVLEARKWRCFFIGSGQTFDAEVLPTKVTENFNSRVVFFSSDRRARMSGLENDVIKDLLPQIRRAGSGVMIFDCSRWDSPVIGAIPKIDVEDMMEFLQGGTNRDEPETMPPLPYQHVPEKPQGRIFLREMVHETGPLTNGSKTLVDAFPDGPETVPSSPNLGPDDKELDADQARLFSREYRRAMQKGSADIKAILRAIGVGNRYYRHAAFLAGQIK